MATARPRTAGIGAALRRQSMRVYNEPFTPNVEERDENEAYVLLLQLPGFNDQHAKVRIEKEERTVVVTGDQLVGSNRLLILNKSYPIPQNCVIENIDHKLNDGILTITMPKLTSESATAEPEQGNEEISPANATPPPKETEQTTAKKGSEEIPPVNLNPPHKETEQKTQEQGSEKISPVNAAPPETKAEVQESEEKDKAKSAELQNQTSAKAKEEAPTPMPAPAVVEKTPVQGENAAPPETKAEVQKSEEKENGKSAELQKQASTKTKEETRAPALTPTVIEKTPVQRDSGEKKTTSDQKISSPDQKPTEKKETENKNKENENEKESKTEEVGKNEETAKIGTGTPSPRASRVGKLAGGFRVGRMPLPVTASLAAAIVMAVAAYLAYAYYGLSLARE